VGKNSKNIYQLIEMQSIKNPNKAAVKTSQNVVTYGELKFRSLQIAKILRNEGAVQQTLIGIMMDHCPEIIESILAVHKIGAAYVPIDPGCNEQSIKNIIKDSCISILITKKQYRDKVPFCFKGVLIEVDGLAGIYNENIQELSTKALPDDLAYVMPTSGSTGRPKLVMIKNRGLWNYINWAAKYYCYNIDLVAVPFFTSISFDLTITSIYMPLVTGGTIYCFPDSNIEEVVKASEINFLKLTPSQLSLIKNFDNRTSNIRKIIVGGERLKTENARKAWESFGCKVEIFNEYGPTETTVGSIVKKFNPKEKFPSVLIGTPISNTRVYLLDSNMKQVAAGKEGEIYISGEGVAKGYMNMVEKTAESFFADPFAKDGSMYKTGDLGRYVIGSELEYLGRIQIPETGFELKGNKIRVDYIENTLLTYSGIEDAIGVVKKDDIGEYYIELFYVSEAELNEKEILEYLKANLSSYMIPKKITRLSKMPLNYNCKVSRPILRGIEY
jgi:tyrocidine synthetase-3